MRAWMKSDKRKYSGSIVRSGGRSCASGYARGPDPAGEGGVEVMSRCYGGEDARVDLKDLIVARSAPGQSGRRRGKAGARKAKWKPLVITHPTKMQVHGGSKEPQTKYKLRSKSPRTAVSYQPSEQVRPGREYGLADPSSIPQRGPDYTHVRACCPEDVRIESPMPYAGYSYRGVRGRTFAHAEDEPNCHSVKDAHNLEEYAEKTAELIGEYGAPPWVHHKLSEIRQHIGDVKHFLEHEYGRAYAVHDDWSEHGSDPNYMAYQNLHVIAGYGHAIVEILKGLGQTIPTWAADRLAKARTSMAEVYHYLEYHLQHHSDEGREYGRARRSAPSNTRSRKKRRRRASPARAKKVVKPVGMPGSTRGCVHSAKGLNCGSDGHKCWHMKYADGTSAGFDCCACTDGAGHYYVNRR